MSFNLEEHIKAIADSPDELLKIARILRQPDDHVRLNAETLADVLEYIATEKRSERKGEWVVITPPKEKSF